ncbi:conserved hypothetical protein [Talaromyces stipitatus ATCC 10500]|uniref:SMODS and SLOG-associating 2TM effector domain-containing protein n=1 Tax=Talaromyces stipitatus (strain ATCC 10500 / CBS 375.48 / QM 6759 / NRRL 1006) TaxID=441959 RepID=B8M3B7_TALSN|nr:uncharacterized protein TSTA_095380 [Talaromyces stipitatus ATCC 10500]EED22289.1 conserved hypothetical protein [Talaromyces stipitatus ATCC 10500]
MSRLFSFDREEKGFPPEAQNSIHPPPTQPYTGVGITQFEPPQQPPPSLPLDERERISQIYNLHHTHNLIPPDNKLLVFRSLTGIDSVPVLSSHGFFSPRNAPNVGIYTRVVNAEQAAAFRYRVFNILINTSLGIQIVVAAALTAIGAANGPHGAVTAFGAINTIMAGILTYLRGSGLPHKERNIEKAWGQIREYIEQREREFCLENCMLNVEDEIHNIERMYEEVRTQMEAGASDSGGKRGGLENLSSLRPRGSLLADAKGAAQTGFDAVRGAISGHRDQTEHHMRDELRNLGQRFQGTRDETEHHFRDQLQNLGQRLSGARDQVRDTSAHLRGTADDIRHTGEDLRETGEQVRQAGENLRDADVHLSVHTPSVSLSRHGHGDAHDNTITATLELTFETVRDTLQIYHQSD